MYLAYLWTPLAVISCCHIRSRKKMTRRFFARLNGDVYWKCPLLNNFPIFYGIGGTHSKQLYFYNTTKLYEPFFPKVIDVGRKRFLNKDDTKECRNLLLRYSAHMPLISSVSKKVVCTLVNPCSKFLTFPEKSRALQNVIEYQTFRTEKELEIHFEFSIWFCSLFSTNSQRSVHVQFIRQ